MSELQTLEESRHRLRVSHPTLHKLIRTGQLESVRIGRRRFVTSAAIDAFIDRNTEAGAA